ncbi:hypothetical protein NGRA_1684 [Nosema granulosis]|uniref:Uncharacterized protein n=1 Tax=Nosema granulosis TaxID=83296 RepID=A0A9P6GYI7_9MICR|nr:hypothetical protein NGRA_1684 [Nosema granulosis]
MLEIDEILREITNTEKETIFKLLGVCKSCNDESTEIKDIFNIVISTNRGSFSSAFYTMIGWLVKDHSKTKRFPEEIVHIFFLHFGKNIEKYARIFISEKLLQVNPIDSLKRILFGSDYLYEVIEKSKMFFLESFEEFISLLEVNKKKRPSIHFKKKFTNISNEKIREAMIKTAKKTMITNTPIPFYVINNYVNFEKTRRIIEKK